MVCYETVVMVFYGASVIVFSGAAVLVCVWSKYDKVMR